MLDYYRKLRYGNDKSRQIDGPEQALPGLAKVMILP